MKRREGRVIANGIDFAYLETGSGPLALCLHGFPDSPHTYRHLMPALAEAGYRAVAPFMRGYAPTAIPADGRFTTTDLVADANALHEALGGDPDAVIIGHDWGVAGGWGAPVHAPDRWRRVVVADIPPMAVFVVSSPREASIPQWEQVLSAGAVCTTLLYAALAMGYGANWITDWYAYDADANAVLGLAPGERVAGFMLIGTARESPLERERPERADLVTHWDG